MRAERFDTPGPLLVRVEIPAGEVDLQTADGTETIVELDGPEQLVEDARVELRPRGDGHELHVETHRRAGLRLFRLSPPGVQLRIRAPHRASVEIDSASANVAGRGRFGDIRVDSASGDVVFDDVDGDAKTSTASGDVQIARLGGTGKVQSASGDVEIGEAAGSVKVQTASGDLEIGSVASGKISLQSASGDIEVGVRRGSKVWIDARSMSGETISELEVGDTPPNGDGPAVEVQATTMSGDIAVRRAT